MSTKPGKHQARLHYQELDALNGFHKEAQAALKTEARKHAAVQRLRTVPGLGLIRAAQVVAVVVSPHRFRTKRQLWAYAGLGIVMRSSSDWVKQDGRLVKIKVAQTRGLNRNHNRMLKNVFKGAAMTVVSRKASCPLRSHYDRMVENRTKPNLARLTIARKIAATVLAMWKNEETYNPDRT